MDTLYTKNTNNKSLDSVEEFWRELAAIYKQKNIKKIATKDLEKILDNKTLICKNLVKYSIKFKVLFKNNLKPYTDKISTWLTRSVTRLKRNSVSLCWNMVGWIGPSQPRGLWHIFSRSIRSSTLAASRPTFLVNRQNQTAPSLAKTQTQ